MHLFVSYSRSDADFVHRLARRLEGDGHDVWVDTDDLVGSEQWRASIVDAVRRADAVLLVVSPRSMASENVEREVTLAAEEGRRIVPLVLEPADMTGNILFELAGTQQLSFADRPFEVAVADLEAELRRLGQRSPLPAPGGAGRGAPPPPVPATTGDAGEPEIEHRRRSSRTSRLVGSVAVVLVLLAAGVVYLLTRDDGGSNGVSAQAATTLGPATTNPTGATTAAASTGEEVALDADVWFSGFAIAADRVTYDPADRSVELAVTFTNDQFGPSDPVGLLVDGKSALEWSGGRASPFCACSGQLPPGASLPATLSFDVGDGFALDGAVLVFGGPRQHQARIPLDGSPAESERPVSRDVSGSIDDGAGTTFTVESVSIVPAACSGLADGLRYMPASASDVSVQVIGSAVRSGSGGVNFGEAMLVLPNGTPIASTTLSGSVYALYENQPQHDIGICFVVPAPAEGSYRLVVTAVGVDPDPEGLTFTM